MSRLSELFIVTGSSSGLGAALVERLELRLNASSRLHLVHGSRSLRPIYKKCLTSLGLDVRDEKSVLAFVKEIEQIIRSNEIKKIVLIQNAGVLGPVSFVSQTSSEAWRDAFDVNVFGCYYLLKACIPLVEKYGLKGVGVHISSGAASKSYRGWSAYCATKAAMESLVSTTALELNTKGIAFKICNLAPGVVDTPMQAQIRQSELRDFPDKPRFERLFSEGLLSDPLITAEDILEWIDKGEFISGGSYDLRSI